MKELKYKDLEGKWVLCSYGKNPQVFEAKVIQVRPRIMCLMKGGHCIWVGKRAFYLYDVAKKERSEK